MLLKRLDFAGMSRKMELEYKKSDTMRQVNKIIFIKNKPINISSTKIKSIYHKN